MKLITFQDIQRLGPSPAECCRWASEMILRKPEALMPAKLSLKPAPGCFFNVMPAIIPDGPGIPACIGSLGGLKVITRYPDRPGGLDSRILLFDAQTGEYLALLDGNWITAMRTGAVAAHSVRLFARRDFKCIAIAGLGNVARAALLSLAALFPQRELEIRLLRYKDQAAAFRERFAAYGNLRFSEAGAPSELVKNADVVLSAVSSLPGDFCPETDFAPGVLLQPVFSGGFACCDEAFDKAFTDDLGYLARAHGTGAFRSLTEVCEVARGTAPGRESDGERIIVYNIGIPIHDLCFAAHIYDRLRSEALPELSMPGPADRFWL